MIAMSEALIEKGYAYVVGGDVFYSVAKFPSYGKLSGKQIEELEAGARVEVHEGKRDPLDFALWKAAKPGEPSWPSPWGEGRPGWHIECSVMSTQHLGETFDIHGGGRDLQFPHHDNEIAQTEAATGKPFVRYWIHNGFINIDKAKMSKSLGNILTIEDILKELHPEVVRIFLLSHHYRSPIDYNELSLLDAKKNLDYFYTTRQRCEEALEASAAGAEVEKSHPIWTKVNNLEASFREALDDDFNSALALGYLFRAAGAMNSYLDGKERESEKAAVARAFLAQLLEASAVFGILGEEPSAYFRWGQEGLDEAHIEAKIAERQAARQAKDWALADAVRDELAQEGVVLEDKPDGTTVWKVRTQA
jgi:cysteinyl-tRNA synthetase